MRIIALKTLRLFWEQHPDCPASLPGKERELTQCTTPAIIPPYRCQRIHSVLRVAHASVLPDCPRATPNVVTMMLGERSADGIRQGL